MLAGSSQFIVMLIYLVTNNFYFLKKTKNITWLFYWYTVTWFRVVMNAALVKLKVIRGKNGLDIYQPKVT